MVICTVFEADDGGDTHRNFMKTALNTNWKLLRIVMAATSFSARKFMKMRLNRNVVTAMAALLAISEDCIIVQGQTKISGV